MMFYTLLGVSITVSAVVAACVTGLFHKSVHTIYEIISNDAMARACARYVVFASMVVGIASGVRTSTLARYLRKEHVTDRVLDLTPQAWVLEVWGAVDAVLGNLAWVYLWVFHLALVAYIVLRAFGRIRNESGG